MRPFDARGNGAVTRLPDGLQLGRQWFWQPRAGRGRARIGGDGGSR